MINKTPFLIGILIVGFMLQSCMLATWTVAYSLPEVRTIMANSERINSSELVGSPETYDRKVVSVSGTISSISEETYVLDNVIDVSVDQLDWPLFQDEEVVIKGRVQNKDRRIKLVYPYLERSPPRTVAQVSSNPGAYHTKFVNISGVVTADHNEYFILSDRITVDYNSSRGKRPAIGSSVELRGQLLISHAAGKQIRLGSVNTIGR